MSVTKVLRRNSLVWWRAWRSSFFFSVLTPVMFISAMGMGLGSMVEERSAFGGVEYVAFFGTGMLAASCMQAGVFQTTYPVFSKITWQKNYDAMLATPLSVKDIVLGELGWSAVRLVQMSVPFFVVLVLFGAIDSTLAPLAIPVVVLMGTACSALMFAVTATLQTDEAYTWIFRFIVTPLFLLSGTFFPIEELPTWGRVVAYTTPLFHGVELVRQLALYGVEPSAWWHLGYLLAALALGVYLGIRNLDRRLRP
jgi:lipooligosaccharide transport system permease protein